MAIDRWFIGGGAEHTPESARRLVYASTGGAEGVGGVNDLKVLPLAVPGAGVRVVVGSGLIKSRYVGGETQTYMGTVYEQETVSIAPTGSGSARSDLIVLRVEDPFAAGSPWPTPSSVETAPYIHIRVVSGVPAGTRRVQDVPGHANDTALTLARIDIPAATGTVIESMIVDLRSIGMAKSVRQRELITPTANNLTGTAEKVWPEAATQNVVIPTWANELTAMVSLLGLLARNNWVGVEFRLKLGTTIFSPVSGLTTDTDPGSVERIDKIIPFRVAIPESLRGTTQPMVILARQTGGTGLLQTTTRTVVEYDIDMEEKI